MTPPPDLAGLIAYVRSRDRQHSIDGRLLAEVDRLRAWVSALGGLDDIDTDNRGWMARDALAGSPAPTKETPDV